MSAIPGALHPARPPIVPIRHAGGRISRATRNRRIDPGLFALNGLARVKLRAMCRA